MDKTDDQFELDLASLEKKSPELAACVRAMTLIGSSLDLDEVLAQAIRSAEEIMGAEASSIMLLDEETGELFFTQATGKASAAVSEIRIPPGQGIAGAVAATGRPIVVEDAQNDDRFYKEADDATGFVTRSILAVPLRTSKKIIGVAEAINKKDAAFSESDLPLFSAYASLAAVAIDNARMAQSLVTQEVVAREIEIARQIQDGLQGPPEAFFGDYKFYGLSTAARSVGGDFYDWIVLGDGRVIFAIGDVSGKGVPAALFMANAVSLLRSEAPRVKEPHEILASLNNTLRATSQRGMFVTMFVAIFEPDGTMHYATAGHHMPLYLPGGDKGDFKEMEVVKAPPLTIVPDVPFGTATIKLNDGDILTFFTDGVTEATSPDGDFFEYDRLKDTLLAGAKTPSLIPQKVRLAVNKFEAGSEQTDDLTIGVISFRSPREMIELKFDNLTPDDLAEIRSEIEGFLAEWAIDEKTRTSIQLSVDEACTNVIRHAYEGKGGPAIIRFSIQNKELEMRLEDHGSGHIPDMPCAERPAELKPGGLGLQILQSVMDEVRFDENAPSGCILIMKKKLEEKLKNA